MREKAQARGLLLCKDTGAGSCDRALAYLLVNFGLNRRPIAQLAPLSDGSI